MTNRSTGRTIAIAAIVLVVVAAVGIGFYRLGRSTATPPVPQATPSSDAPRPTDSSPSPGYSATDQNGSPEPALPRGQATAGEGGSRTGPVGLPLGYSHDKTGAVNAATNYLMWMNSIRITDKKIADEMATSAAADQATRKALTKSFDLLRSGMENVTADQPQPARGAYAIASYHDNRALVYIWSPEVTTDASGQTDSLWGIDAVPLVWSSGDWKLDQALIAKTGGAAVDPSDPTAAEKHSILARTPADPGEITDSAEQTWFEYGNAPH